MRKPRTTDRTGTAPSMSFRKVCLLIRIDMTVPACCSAPSRPFTSSAAAPGPPLGTGFLVHSHVFTLRHWYSIMYRLAHGIVLNCTIYGLLLGSHNEVPQLDKKKVKITKQKGIHRRRGLRQHLPRVRSRSEAGQSRPMVKPYWLPHTDITTMKLV